MSIENLLMINEKTGVLLDTIFWLSGQPHYLGVVFEPRVDFATKTITKSVKSVRVYEFRSERFRKVLLCREKREFVEQQAKSLLNRLAMSLIRL